jgi:hypothetical protein
MPRYQQFSPELYGNDDAILNGIPGQFPSQQHPQALAT